METITSGTTIIISRLIYPVPTMLYQSVVAVTTSESAPYMTCNKTPRTIPKPKAVNTRLVNEKCFFCIQIKNPIIAAKTTMFMIMKSISTVCSPVYLYKAYNSYEITMLYTIQRWLIKCQESHLRKNDHLIKTNSMYTG